MMPNFLRIGLVLVAILATSVGVVRPVQADGIVGNGTATSCTEAALNTALSTGGTITFNCGGAATIILSSQKTISVDTTLDGANLITLSGSNTTRLFLVNASKTLALNNIVLTNGYADGNGGAIVSNGNLSLTRSMIRNSQTTTGWSGGAILSFGILTITDSLLEGNRAGNGGALFVRGAQTTIHNSVFRQNATTSTTDGWGGAMLLWNGVHVEIVGGEIANNTARLGGGLYNRPDATVTLDGGTRIHDNAAIAGGGIYNFAGTTTLTNVTLQGNTADPGGGGGIYNFTGTATLTNVTLQGNTATSSGGGIYNTGTATLTNVTLQGNTVPDPEGDGGGIANFTGTTTLTNVTLQGNGAAFGASISNYGSTANHLYLKNVVIADSAAGNHCGGPAADSATFSLSSDTSCVLNGAGNRTNTPALLGPLQNNGGATLTLLPQSNSPLIDGGQCTVGVATDQRGVPRPQGAACDIGAVEVAPVSTATPPTATMRPTATSTPVPPSPTSVMGQTRTVFLPLVRR